MCIRQPVYPTPGNGRPPVGLERMLRLYFLQHWFNLCHPRRPRYDVLKKRQSLSPHRWVRVRRETCHVEKIHTGQVLEGRYESKLTASPMQRLLAEWLAERARFIGSLIGLTDEQFNRETAPNQWTYRVVAKHVLTLEQDSLKTIASDQAARLAANH